MSSKRRTKQEEGSEVDFVCHLLSDEYHCWGQAAHQLPDKTVSRPVRLPTTLIEKVAYQSCYVVKSPSEYYCCLDPCHGKGNIIPMYVREGKRGELKTEFNNFMSHMKTTHANYLFSDDVHPPKKASTPPLNRILAFLSPTTAATSVASSSSRDGRSATRATTLLKEKITNALTVPK